MRNAHQNYLDSHIFLLYQSATPALVFQDEIYFYQTQIRLFSVQRNNYIKQHKIRNEIHLGRWFKFKIYN